MCLGGGGGGGGALVICPLRAAAAGRLVGSTGSMLGLLPACRHHSLHRPGGARVWEWTAAAAGSAHSAGERRPVAPEQASKAPTRFLRIENLLPGLGERGVSPKGGRSLCLRVGW